MPTYAEEMWKKSERAYDAKTQRTLNAQWYRFHMDQAQKARANGEHIACRHENEAARFAWVVSSRCKAHLAHPVEAQQGTEVSGAIDRGHLL